MSSSLGLNASSASTVRSAAFKLQQLIFVFVVLFPVDAWATVYTVKTSGGNFSSISSCAGTAVAGDTCQIYAGSYAGWTQNTSGNAGNPIIFTVNPGDAVTVTSGITISSRSYITIQGPGLTTQGQVSGNGSSSHNIMDHILFRTCTAFNINDGLGSGGSDNIVSNSTVDRTGCTTTHPAFYVYGDRNRFDNNEIKNGEADCFEIGGANLIVRNNYCHDYNGASGEHLDFVQIIGGGTSPTLSFSLIEGNRNQNCTNDGGNCHGFAIIRTGGPVADTNILRYNYAQNIDGDCINFGGSGDNVPNNSAYNNTCASGHLASYSTSFDSTQGNTPNINVLNNIAYNVQSGGQPPFSSNSPGIENGN